MEVTFWGVRGSYPTPAPETVRYGGNTSCVEVRALSGDRLVVDAGTGLTRLGDFLANSDQLAGTHHILLSHLHWDHIQGLPFFAPAYDPRARISIHAMPDTAKPLAKVLAGVARHEFFPAALDDFAAPFDFHEVMANQQFAPQTFRVMPFRLNHPSGAMGYRIDADGTSCAYVCDTAPFTEVLHKRHFLRGLEPLDDKDRQELQALRDGVVKVITDCDTVIYDTHFLPEEYAKFPHFGHSTPDQALALCTGIGIRQLVLYHHAPNHDDAILDQMANVYANLGQQVGLQVVTAREGLVLQVGADDAGTRRVRP